MNSATEAEAEAALAELFRVAVGPVVRGVLRGKMRASLAKDDVSPRNLDALDLASEIDLQLLRAFREFRTNRTGAQLQNPQAYVHAVTNNAFRQFLRDKYPLRFRLKNKIKYICRNQDRFAIWKNEEGKMLCGFAAHAGTFSRVALTPGIYSEIEPLNLPASDIDDNRRILSLLQSLLEQAGGPVYLDELVTVIATLLGISGQPEVELVEDFESAGDTDLEEQVTERISLQTFWTAIASLPIRHRTALLLNLRGDSGENLLRLLPLLRIASLRSIAEALEMSFEEFAEIWPLLPLDDNAIAQRLGVTRQQVINLRQSARSNLRRRRDEHK